MYSLIWGGRRRLNGISYHYPRTASFFSTIDNFFKNNGIYFFCRD